MLIPATIRATPTNCYCLRPGLAAGSRRACQRRHADVAGGIRIDLQHARQQQEPDQRPVAHLRSGFRRSRRRRRLHALDRRLPQLLRSRPRPRRHLASAGRQHVRARAARACACSTTSRWARTWFAALRRPASVRATSRRERRTMRSAARSTGAPASKSNIRSTSCPRMPASAAPCSSMPARCGATRARRQYAATGEINGLVNAVQGGFFCQCGMQFADSAAVRMSAGASIIWDSPFGPLRFDFAYPILKQGYDRTQFFAFGGGTHF